MTFGKPWYASLDDLVIAENPPGTPGRSVRGKGRGGPGRREPPAGWAGRGRGGWSGSGGPEGDPDTVLLVHWDGPDGATAATDESLSGHAITFNGDAKLATDEKVFGTAALHIDTGASSSGVSIPNSEDFRFGTDPFTVETRYYFGLDDNRAVDLISFRTSSSGTNNSWTLQHDARSAVRDFRFFWHDSGGTFSGFLSGGTPTLGAWHALAVDWDGTTLRMYLNGSVIASTGSYSGVFGTTVAPLTIGTRSGDSTKVASQARFDETRISRVARYAGAYTPAAEAFAA